MTKEQIGLERAKDIFIKTIPYDSDLARAAPEVINRADEEISNCLVMEMISRYYFHLMGHNLIYTWVINDPEITYRYDDGEKNDKQECKAVIAQLKKDQQMLAAWNERQKEQIVTGKPNHKRKYAPDFSKFLCEVPALHRKGYVISEYDYQLQKAMRKVKLFRTFDSGTILDSSKLKNSAFDAYFDAYEKFCDRLKNVSDDTELVRNSVLLYELEKIYQIDNLYKLAAMTNHSCEHLKLAAELISAPWKNTTPEGEGSVAKCLEPANQQELGATPQPEFLKPNTTSSIFVFLSTEVISSIVGCTEKRLPQLLNQRRHYQDAVARIYSAPLSEDFKYKVLGPTHPRHIPEMAAFIRKHYNIIEMPKNKEWTKEIRLRFRKLVNSTFFYPSL